MAKIGPRRKTGKRSPSARKPRTAYKLRAESRTLAEQPSAMDFADKFRHVQTVEDPEYVRVELTQKLNPFQTLLTVRWVPVKLALAGESIRTKEHSSSPWQYWLVQKVNGNILTLSQLIANEHKYKSQRRHAEVELAVGSCRSAAV